VKNRFFLLLISHQKIIPVKFDDHFAAYLYEKKSLSLEGIGTFMLDDKVRVPGGQEKEVFYPIEGLEFTYNPKSVTDENLVIFLVKRLGKIEPLVRSDVEYYLSHIRQFLNIGNPYTIEGIGTLNKTNHRTFEFTPGNFLAAKEQLTPHRENADHNYPVKSKASAGRVFIIIVIALFALSAIGGIGWGIYNFIKNQPISAKISQPQADTIAQPVNTAAATKDSEIINSKSSKSLPAPVAGNKADMVTITDTAANNLISYKMIFEITKSEERAHSRTAQLNNLQSNTQYDSIPINDSVAYYRLFLPMKVASADTPRIKDSLEIFFGKKIFLEKE
jgi:hypothetical protein